MADRGRRAELVELAASARSRRARRLPGGGAGAARRDLDWSMFEGITSLGITAGASAPEVIVEEIMDAFAQRYDAACGDGLGGGRKRVLPAAAFACVPRPRRVTAMAVYTDVADDDLADFLKRYGIGELLSYKGIAEGVENSNFLLHTSKGAYILTLYEKRVDADDLPSSSA
jgi:hypothetical protein